MTRSILDTIAEAIAADLANPDNAAAFGVPFVVERVSHLDFAPEKLKAIGTKPKLFVYGADERRSGFTRGWTEREWEIHVGVVKRLAGDGNDEIDPLRLLVERVADFCELRQPTGIDDQRWAGMELVPYIPELIKELTFVGVVSLTFKGEGDAA